MDSRDESTSLLYALLKKRPRTLKDLSEQLELDEIQVELTINILKDEGYAIEKVGQYYQLRTLISTQDNVVVSKWNGERVIKFGVASDMHMCSKHQQLTHLNTIYDIFQDAGITTVYNPGDISEGYGMRKGHEYEVFKYGADEQVDYISEMYPKRKGMVTEFITGNHDHSHLKNGGIDIGKPIARNRSDLKYLGMNNATIMLTPNCRMDLAHPLDGSSYAISYAVQKAIEAMSTDNIPNIYITGHHHKAMYFFYRDIHCLEAGCFEAQTPWMRGKRLAAHVGGWIVTVHVDENGFIQRFVPEWIPFTRSIHHDY